MSEEFWEELKAAYPVGTCLAKVLGYVKVPLFMTSKDGEVISFELEAYIVRNMRVPLLLGEDFQSAYELGIQRWKTGRSEVQVGQSKHIIPASSAHSMDLGFEVRQASMAKSMKRLLPGVWRKTYQRSKARKRREGQTDSPPVLAERDTLIAAGTVHNVRITGAFEGRNEWLVEKIVIATEDESHPSLRRKTQNTVAEMAKTKQALADLEGSLDEAVVATWEAMAVEWKKDVTKPNPFTTLRKDRHVAQVRAELAEEAAAREAARKEPAGSVKGDMHITELIAMGLQLEDQQRILAFDVAAPGAREADPELPELMAKDELRALEAEADKCEAKPGVGQWPGCFGADDERRGVGAEADKRGTGADAEVEGSADLPERVEEAELRALEAWQRADECESGVALVYSGLHVRKLSSQLKPRTFLAEIKVHLDLTVLCFSFCLFITSEYVG
ncbi:hypothetical protein C8R46DRAFT_1214004 [Mycena filopes]|nr:hypothetical protein C8R46DRAFT_1214004 [Mycena filopes]